MTGEELWNSPPGVPNLRNLGPSYKLVYSK